MTYDLVIRGGMLADGTGGEIRRADVAITNGRIAAVGAIADRGAQEMDAAGLLVTPGFVDVHTHYDGQATWDERMQPSSWHGVTTVVMGNCGVGFAPCRPQDRDRLVRLMEGVEDIPFPVLSQGLPWNWQSYPDYLDSLAARRFDVDIGSQLPHAALRVFVMGERGANREPATADDIEAMAALAGEAMRAGALGFSTSRTLNHRTSDGQPTPTLRAGEDELMAIANAMGAAGKGVLQFVSDFADSESEFNLMRRLVEVSGRPLTFSLAQNGRDARGYRRLLDRLAEAVAAGLPMKAQVAGRPVGVLLGLELTMNPFSQTRAWREIAGLPLAARVERLTDPAFRRRLLDEPVREDRGGALRYRNWGQMFLMDADPDYEPTADRAVAALAAQRGLDPAELALDHMLTEGGTGLLYVPILNYADGSLDASYEMLTDPNTVPGLADGGAHVGMICDGSFPTSNITHWTRDRTRGPRLALEAMIAAQTRDTARSVGLLDRGVVAPGYRADLNIIDYDRLALKAPSVAHDLPAGGRRLLQRSEGYVATLVAGQATYLDGRPTGALPGRLLRGAQPQPDARTAP